MEAIEAWKQEPFKAHFGQVVSPILSSELEPTSDQGKIGMSDGLDLFAAEFDRVKAHEARWSSKPSIAYLDSPEAILATLKAPSKLALFENKKAYFNPEGGFARASDAMRTLLELCRAAGVQFEVGDAIKLVLKDGQCLGAELRDGRKLFGDLTVAACGGWAPSLLPDLKDCLVATGQVWATVKLTAEEMLLYKDMPVVACAPTGL
jgi:glycine/D-amino acid oxidase-like deaminating enzyme